MRPSSIQFLGWNSSHPCLFLLILIYSVVRELFSSNSANSLYDKAVADCLAHEKLADLLGEPVKAFGELTVQLLTVSLCVMHAGEENRRHRRTHVAQKHYVDPQGRKGVRLQFYLQGVIIVNIGIGMSLFVS